MARIGMRYPKYAVVTVTVNQNGTESETYGTVKVIGKAISASTSINYTTSPLYGDNGKAEEVREFTGGTLNLNTDDIEPENQAELSGATADNSGNVDYGSDDTAPYVRFGYVRKRIKAGAVQYGGIIYTRVKFAPPDEEDNTKGETITYGTPKLNGSIMKDAAGKWKKTSAWLETEAAAVTWLDTNLRPTT